MADFLISKRNYNLNASQKTQFLVGKKVRQLPQIQNSTVVTTIKKHIDYVVDVRFVWGDGSPDEYESFTIGKPYQELPSKTRDGYYFNGWYTASAGGTLVDEDAIADYSVTTLYAQWDYIVSNKRIEYVVQTTPQYNSANIDILNKADQQSPIYIDWGDGTIEKLSTVTILNEHQYSDVGLYTIKINNINWIQINAASSDMRPNRYVLKNILYNTALMGEACFKYCQQLSSLHWLSTYQEQYLAQRVFDHAGLTSLDGMQYSPISSIRAYCFSNCTNLRSLSGIDNIKQLYSNAFEYCTSLHNVDQISASSIKNIPSQCFQYCTGISSIEGIKHVDSCQSNAFRGCTGLSGALDLTDFDITSLTTTFTDCYNITSFSLPLKYEGQLFDSCSNCRNLRYIDFNNNNTILTVNMFSCRSLSSIDLPSSVVKVGFQQCSSLVSVDLPNITSLNSSAFDNCFSLISIYLPDSLTYLDQNGYFSNCTSLSSVRLPKNLSIIPRTTFNNCTSLHHIEIPSSVSAIYDTVFKGCINLNIIDIQSDIITYIFGSVFSGCYNLSSLTINTLQAPTIYSGTFGTSASLNKDTGYAGYASRGQNVLRIPKGATGYDQGTWLSVLLNPDKCGFHIEYIDSRDEVSLDDGSTLYAEGKISAIAIE